MALDTGFVAAVLEGIEGTLGELIERVETSELRASLDVLQSRVTALRVSIEPGERAGRDRRTRRAGSRGSCVDPSRLSCPMASLPLGPTSTI
jgi:hypothetical protein